MNAYSTIRTFRITFFVLFVFCCIAALIAWGLNRHTNLENYRDKNDYNAIINFAQLVCSAFAAIYCIVFIGCVFKTHGNVSKGDIEETEDNALYGTICALLALLAIGLIFAFQYLRHHPEYADDYWNVTIRTIVVLLILLFITSIFTLFTGKGAARAVNATRPDEDKDKDNQDEVIKVEKLINKEEDTLSGVPAIRISEI